MAFRHARRFSRPLLYTSAAAVVGSASLYYVYRPKNIPGVVTPATPSQPAKIGPAAYNFPKIATRQEQIRSLQASAAPDTRSSEEGSQQERKEYDLLVIGAGATGTGIALDAASRGLKVALVEKDDFSAGTSSKSTKLVHGGVRYLEKAVWHLDYNQYALVKEALHERRAFLHIAPHLSSWLPIMLPVQKWWKVPYFWVGTKCYDYLAGSEGIESSYFLTRSRALDQFPMLKSDGLFGALVYYDGAHNDSRMNVSLAMTSALYGATVVNHLEVTDLTKDENGKLNGAIVKDTIDERNSKSTQPFQIKAKGVVNAAGPFCDNIRKMDDQNVKQIVAPSSGVHIVLPGYFSPSKMGLIDPATSDGRVIFFLPWEGSTIAGTTDRPTGITENPVPNEEDINWILDEIRGYLAPDINVRREDVLAAWSGIRPLVRDPHSDNTQNLVRNHLVTVSDSGLMTCAGGKWTTYRQMAQDTVDAAIERFNLEPQAMLSPNISGLIKPKPFEIGATTDAELDGTCKTHLLRLVGAHGYSKTLFINLIQHFNISTDVAKHLAESYGDRAWAVASLSATNKDSHIPFQVRLSSSHPFIDGEVRYAVRSEYAETATDIIGRRTRLAFLDSKAALASLPTVVDIMADELKWSRARKAAEFEDAKSYLETMGLKA